MKKNLKVGIIWGIIMILLAISIFALWQMSKNENNNDKNPITQIEKKNNESKISDNINQETKKDKKTETENKEKDTDSEKEIKEDDISIELPENLELMDLNDILNEKEDKEIIEILDKISN